MRLCVAALCLVAALANQSCQRLHPGVLQQLLPYFGGIQSRDMHAASDFFLVSYFGDSNRTRHDIDGQLNYNYSLAYSMSSSDPDFPWSMPFFVKVTVLDGEIYLPGGDIPVNGHGFSFTNQGTHMLYHLLDLHDQASLPDLEMFVASPDFPVVHERHAAGGVTPVFQESGSKTAYSLVLPGPWANGASTGESLPHIPWEQRQDRIVSRFNMMCPRDNPLQLRERLSGDVCPRFAMHKLNNSTRNSQGITVDVGAVGGVDNPVPFMSTQELARAKYALCLDGATFAYRLRNLLEGGQAVIQDMSSPLFGWFHSALRPWEHYIPLGDQFDSIFDLADFLHTHDELASHIAASGHHFARSLTPEVGFCYSRFLLQEYAKLLRFKPQIGKRAVTLREGLEDFSQRVKALRG